MDSIKKQRLIEIVVIVGFTISIAYHLIANYLFNLSYPYNTFLFRRADVFGDLFSPFRIALDPYIKAQANYQHYPFYYTLLRLLHVFQNEFSVLAFYFLAYITFFSLFLFVNLKRNNKKDILIGLLVLTGFSYPFLFSLDRGNLEFIIVILIVLFLFFYQKNQFLCVLFLSLAIAIKPFPAVFLALFIVDHRYRDLILTIIFSAVITLASYWILPGNIIPNIYEHLRNLALYNQVYVIGNEGLFFGNSLWGAIKYLQILINPLVGVDYSLLMKPYMVLVLSLFIFLIWYMWKRNLSFERKIIILICSMNLFPYVSADYKLLYFYIPIMMYINSDTPIKSGWVFGLLLGLLMVPKSYVHLPVLPEASFSVLINPLLMIGLIVMAILTNERAKENVKLGPPSS
jgi:hypothetical protein